MSSQPRMTQQEAQEPGLVVELLREPGDEQFTCSLPDWNFLRDLGQTFGWHPVGTIYLPQQGQRARQQPIKHDYQPGDSQDRKRVEGNDSAQWAAALDGASRSPFISGMLRARAELEHPGEADAEQALRLLITKFIEFARRGAFTIALRRGE